MANLRQKSALAELIDTITHRKEIFKLFTFFSQQIDVTKVFFLLIKYTVCKLIGYLANSK